MILEVDCVAKLNSLGSQKVTAGMKIIIELDNMLAEHADNDFENNKKVSLSSYVEEVLDDETMLIQMPMYKSYNFPLPKNQSVTAYFFSGMRMFVLQVIFVENVRQGRVELAKVRRTSALTPFQRRDCFRLETALPVVVQRLRLDENGDPITPTKTKLINISDGGILIASDDTYEVDERVFITVELDNKTVETLEGRVVRAVATYGVGAFKHHFSVQFEHSCNRQKDRLYKYIVDKQRAFLSTQMRD